MEHTDLKSKAQTGKLTIKVLPDGRLRYMVSGKFSEVLYYEFA